MPTLYDLLSPDDQARFNRSVMDDRAWAALNSDVSRYTPEQRARATAELPSVLQRWTTAGVAIARTRRAHPEIDEASGLARARAQLPGRRSRLLVEGALTPFSGLPGVPELHRTVEPTGIGERIVQGAAGIPAVAALTAPLSAAAGAVGIPAVAAGAAARLGASLRVARAVGTAVPGSVAGGALGAAQPGTARQRLARTIAYGAVGPLGEAAAAGRGTAAAVAAPLASWGVAAPTAESLIERGQLPTAGQLAESAAMTGLMSAHPIARAVSSRMARKALPPPPQPNPEPAPATAAEAPVKQLGSAVTPPSRQLERGPIRLGQRTPRIVNPQTQPTSHRTPASETVASTKGAVTSTQGAGYEQAPAAPPEVRAEGETASGPGSRRVVEPEARTPLNAPGARQYQTDERVSVPNRGRSMGSSEKARVEGYDEAGNVIVRVRRGKSVATETYREDQLRRLPISPQKARDLRVASAYTKLGELTQQQAETKLAQLRQEHEATYEQARGLYPQRGTKPTREYVNARAKMRRLEAGIDAVSRKLYLMTAQPFVAAGGQGEAVSRMGRAAAQLRTEGESIMRGEGPAGTDPGGGTVTPPPTQPPEVARLLEAVKAAKPIRGQQERLYTAERGRRAAAAESEAATSGLAGEARSRARLRHFKGALPVAHFESIVGKLDRPTIDALHERINTSIKLRGEYEKASAVSGLDALLGEHGGKVPAQHEMKLLQRVFGEDLIREVIQHSPIRDKLLRTLAEGAGTLKSLRSMGDFSASLRQGLVLSAGNPRRFAQAFRKQFRYFADPKAFDALHEEIVQRPNYKLYRDSGLDLTEHGALLGGREEAYQSTAAERIPGAGRLVKASERAYTGFLNKLRVDVFDDMVRRYQRLGLDPHGDPKVAREIAEWINDATGRGRLPQALERSSVLLNTLFFSPRLQASRIRLLNPKRYIDASPALRREAAHAAINLLGVLGTTLSVAALGGADVELDPRSSDFAKIRVGNTRYDILGGFQQYARFAATVVTGVEKTRGSLRKLNTKDRNRAEVVKRFLRTKLSPAAGLTLDLLSGYDALGRKVRPVPHIAEQFTPLVWQDFWDAMKEHGLGTGLAIALPSMFGVGVQTYGGNRNRMQGLLQQQPEPAEARP